MNGKQALTVLKAAGGDPDTLRRVHTLTTATAAYDNAKTTALDKIAALKTAQLAHDTLEADLTGREAALAAALRGLEADRAVLAKQVFDMHAAADLRAADLDAQASTLEAAQKQLGFDQLALANASAALDGRAGKIQEQETVLATKLANADAAVTKANATITEYESMIGAIQTATVRKG